MIYNKNFIQDSSPSQDRKNSFRSRQEKFLRKFRPFSEPELIAEVEGFKLLKVLGKNFEYLVHFSDLGIILTGISVMAEIQHFGKKICA